MYFDFLMLEQILINSGAIKFGEFILTSGKKSKYYVNIKNATTKPKILKAIAVELKQHIGECDKIGGVALGAVPLVVAVALEIDKPYIIIRKDRKEHGTKSPIEGDIDSGETIVLIEDVVTTGGSVINAINLLREKGANISRVVTVVDREEGGLENLTEIGVELIALVKASDLVTH